MKYLPNTINSDLDKKVIFSTDDNLVYYFFMPMVSKLWTIMGYQPHIFIVGDESDWLEKNPQKQLVLNTSLAMGANVAILDSKRIQKDKRFRGYNLSMISQISRFCSPCWPGIKDSDYFLISDIDMLPLNKKWLNQQLLIKNIHIFYANGYNHTRYAMCYLGMNVNIWKKVINIKTLNIYDALVGILSELRPNSKRDIQWGYDETFFFNRIKKIPRYMRLCHMINRGVYANPMFGIGDGGGGPMPKMLPIGRIDRSNWVFNGDISECIDAHCKRPGYKEDNWNEIRYLLSYFLDFDELVSIEKYYKEFIKYV